MANSTSDEFDIDLDELGGPSKGSERRTTPREPMKLGVRYGTAQELALALRACTKNIGMGGLCLLTQRPYAAGTHLDLTIEFGAGDSLQVTAVVAWARPGKAIGVRFEKLNSEQRTRLESIVGKRRETAPPTESTSG